MKIKQWLNKKIYPNTCSTEAYVAYLRRCGVRIGEGTWFVKPKNTSVDTQNSIFIEIGNNVCVTDGVTILAHDWSYSVIARAYNDAPGKQKITHIGNNVFLGSHSIVLMGANIGDNVIIGAGSVVSGKVESNSVYAGNPAKKVCTLDEHYQKLQDSFEDSAYCYLTRRLAVQGKIPTLENMGLYASLFVEKTEENMNKYFSKSAIPFAIKNMPKRYDTIEEFLAIKKEKENETIGKRDCSQL